MHAAPPRPPQPARRRPARGRALVLLAAGALACAPGAPDGPRPTTIVPAQGSLAARVPVRIRGEDFGARVTTDFADPSASAVDVGFRALLGTVPLEDVALEPGGELRAIVPAGLASGVYDLTVIDPRGRSGVLARAYRVLVPAEPAAVASYRIEPIGAQEAYRPFMVAVAAVDAAGAVATGFHGSVALSDLTGTGVPGTAARFVAGRWTGLLEVRAPHPADVVAVVDAQGVTGTSAPFAVAPPRAAAVSFATPPLATTAGACAGPITLALQDAFGEAAPAAQTTALALAAPAGAGLAVHRDASCGTPVSAATVAAGESAVSVWIVATRAGPLELTASGANLAAATQRETVAAGAPAALAFVTPPQAVNAGACSAAATVEIRDAHGNPSAPGAATLTVEASPAGGLAFFADAACTAAAPALAVAAGATRADLHFSGTAAQVVSVTVSGSGLGAASQDVLVTPSGRATRLAFLTAPRGAAAGACSEEVTIQALDSSGNAVASAGAALVSLAASPAAGFATFADAACAVPAAVVQIGAGQSTGGFHFRGTLAASVTVTASAPTLTPASQVESVGPAPPALVAFAGAAQGATAGTCSAAVALQVRDRYGNTSPVGAPLPVALSASPAAGLGLHADPACRQPATAVTVEAGASAAGFHFKGTRAGPVVLAATPGGLAGDVRTETIRAAAAARLAFASPPQTLPAGACSDPVSLDVLDAFDNVAEVPGGAMVALAAAPPGVTFHRDAACTSPSSAVALAAGGSGARFWFSAAAAGTFTLTASAGGLDPGTQAETVVAALPLGLAFSSAAQAVTAGDCSGPVTLETRDAQGRPAPVPEAASVALAASPPGGVTLHAGAGCSGPAVSTVALAAGATAATLSLRATSAGALTLRATSPALGAATQVETVRPGAPARLAFATAPRSAAAGACSDPVTVRAEDAHGNPATLPAATALTLSAAPAAGLALYADDACTVPASPVSIPAGGGSATVRFIGTAPGDVTLTAAAAGLGATSQVETVAGRGPHHLAFTSASQRVAAGACSDAVTVEVQDAAGAAAATASALPVSLGASPGAGLSFFAGAGCGGSPVSTLSLAAGASAVTFSFRATASGAVTVTAGAAGLSPSPAQVETVVPGALHHFTWAAIPSPQAPALPFAVAVTARDAWGNVAPSFTGTATLAASSGAVACASACTSGAVTGGFTAGAWMGSVTVSPQARGVTLTAASGAASGTSAAFDVSGPATRSPPAARLTVTPAVLISGNDVRLDAGGSSDHQTPAAQLSVSWDFEANAASMDRAAVPPAAPWTPWTTAKTATHAYINHGASPVVFQPRVAVADAEAGAGGPDVAYASATVVVLPNGDAHCTVDTASDADDGATSCHAKGSDGKLSLREALRLANGASTPLAVDFAGRMTIAFSGTLAVTRPVYLVAQPGVAVDGGTLSIAATGVLVAGLELSRPASRLVVSAGSDVTFRDVHLHDGAGLLVRGRARLHRVTLSGCAGTCIEVDDPGAWLALFDSELRGSGTNTGLALTSCAGAAWSPGTLASPFQAYDGAVLVAGTVFRGFATAVDSSCAAAVLTNDTFAGNDVGVRGVGAALLDGIFSGQTASAVTASSCPGFASSRRHLVWQNASDGCLAAELAPAAADVTFSADPRYVAPAAGDYRIQRDSPARDAGWGTGNVELDGAGPGRFLGAGADRGGRETY